MAKHGKRNQRQLHQSGMGGGQSVVCVAPRSLVRKLPRLAAVSSEANFRRRYVQHANRTSVREADSAFQVPVSTIYRWRTRDRPDDPASLEPRSRRPKTTRKHQWTAAQEQTVRDLRQRRPRMGKLPLRVLLRKQGIHLSAPMIGLMLASLKRRNLLRAPLFAAGAVMLGWLGYRGVLQAIHGETDIPVNSRSGSRSFATGFLMAALNPMGIIYWLSVGSALVAEAVTRTGKAGAPALVGGVFLGLLVWITGLSLALHFGRRFVTARALRWITGGSSALLLGFAIWFAIQALRSIAAL